MKHTIEKEMEQAGSSYTSNEVEFAEREGTRLTNEFEYLDPEDDDEDDDYNFDDDFEDDSADLEDDEDADFENPDDDPA